MSNDIVENLEKLEKLLEVSFAKSLHAFWREYVQPGRVPTFQVQKCKLNGAWGCRKPLLDNPNGWLIQINEKAPREVREVTLAHEITHLALDLEGYPVISPQKDTPRDGGVWREVAAGLHSVLVHPVIWFRMRRFEFPVDDHIRIQATGQLADLRRKPRYPTRSQFPDWQNWTLKYILAGLQWDEPERQEIYDLFKSRHSAIGRQGEKMLDKLRNSFSYSAPESLTPRITTDAGEMLLQRLDLDNHLQLAFIKTIR